MAGSGREYVYALGEQLSNCTDSATRVQLAKMLAMTGLPDAQPYLMEALADEFDDEAREEIRAAVATLIKALEG